MKRTLILANLLLCLFSLSAQRGNNSARVSVSLIDYSILNDGLMVDKDSVAAGLVNTTAPVFKGGYQCLLYFFGDHISYPVIAIENGIQGRVVIQFEIDKYGYVNDEMILRGLDPSCDKEAIAIIRAMPPWIPATYNGKPAKSYVRLQIQFRL
ncbi:MAG: energy transducer TonB [Dysgonomonas sp.]|nr:energy transducer TonB [Dysgonomonas sp.]